MHFSQNYYSLAILQSNYCIINYDDVFSSRIFSLFHYDLIAELDKCMHNVIHFKRL